MSYKFIINPLDDKLYSIHSELGRNLIKQYIQQVGAGAEKKPEETPSETTENKTEQTLKNDDIQTEDVEVNKVLAMWIGGLWNKIKSLFSNNKTEQEGGNDSDEYIKKVLNFIV